MKFWPVLLDDSCTVQEGEGLDQWPCPLAHGQKLFQDHTEQEGLIRAGQTLSD